MLGGGAGMGPTTQVLEEAAEARLSKLKGKLDAAHVHEEPSVIWRLLGFVGTATKVVAATTGLASVYYYYKYDCKELTQVIEETRTKSENAFPGSDVWVQAMSQYLEMRKKLEQQVKDFTDPSAQELLPPLAPELRGRIKTLVLDLDDLLIHKEWTRQKGWSIYKRPGVQDFIMEMGQYYEIVVFTDEPNTYADPIINRLDPHRYVLLCMVCVTSTVSFAACTGTCLAVYHAWVLRACQHCDSSVGCRPHAFVICLHPHSSNSLGM